MAVESISDLGSRMRDAIAEMETLIRGRFPDAQFEVGYGEDPPGTYLWATVDVEESDDVVDVFIHRLVDLQVDEGLSLYVIPLKPRERVLALLEKQAGNR